MATNKKVDITVVETQSLISVTRRSPPLLAEKDLITVGTLKNDQLQILVASDAFSTIDKHSKSDLYNEVGGFLVGRPYEWQGQTYVEIVAALPAESTNSSSVHLTITPDTWTRAYATVRKKFGDMHIVGWYHTHPNMAVFLSAQDMNIHEGFFREPWHVALVVEPSRSEAGFFVWYEKRVQAASGYQIVYPPKTSIDKHWKLSPLHTLTSTRPLPMTLSKFYQARCWRTRWSSPDSVAVKVKPSVITRIEKYAAQSGIVVGMCLGRLYYNIEQKSPEYFVEVSDVHMLGEKLSVSSLTVRLLVDKWQQKKLFNAAPKQSTLQIVGWFWFGANSKFPIHSVRKQFHRKYYPYRWQIFLVGSPERGVESCFLYDTSGKIVARQLVELMASEELSGDGLEKSLAFIKNVVQKLIPSH